MIASKKREARIRRRRRVRKRVSGSAARPRLAVYRSNRHIYVQLVDDISGRTLAAASSLDAEATASGDKKARAKAVGSLMAARAKDAGIDTAVFDRGGFLFHGRVRELAEAAREGGLRI